MAAEGTAEPGGVLSLNRASGENKVSVEPRSKEDGRKISYPFLPMILIMTVTVGQSYAAPGLQAVLELYFSTFLYVCSRRAVRLASTSINVYIAVYQICALPGGYLADRVLGNFKTQVVSNLVMSLGICLVLFSSWQYTQEPPTCCHWPPDNHHNTSSVFPGGALHGGSNCSALHVNTVVDGVSFHLPPNLNLALAILGLTLFAIGYGCTNAIQSVFVADQFPEETSKAKERSFSWYYLFCNVGTLGGELGMPVLRQSVGFIICWITVLGATLPTTALFMFTWCLYTRKKPARPHCTCFHTTQRKPIKKKRNKLEEDTSLDSCRETDPLLAKNVPSDDAAELVVTPKLSWRARARQIVPFLGLFTPLVVFWAIFYQQSSTWIVQGRQMNCYIGRLHVPPDIMPSVNDVLCILIIPLLDYLVYPHIESSMKMKLRPVHKLVAGMLFAAFSFLLSGLLQLYIHLPPGRQHCHGDVSLAWQLPQLLLISFAEILVSVTGLELAYSQAPTDLRNLVTALWYIAQALGVLLNAAVVQIPISLIYQFSLYFVLMLLVTALFIAINCRTTCLRRTPPSSTSHSKQDCTPTKNHAQCR